MDFIMLKTRNTFSALGAGARQKKKAYRPCGDMLRKTEDTSQRKM
ncbi:hypothetical protein [Fictibacillus marinisediminis]|nr:hypothetical protein [Fictibacillus marinisediminis]